MKKKWKLKVIGLLLIGLFLAGAASCEIDITFKSYLSIRNDATNPIGTEIWDVYIVPHLSGGGWGIDQIGGGYIARGSAVEFEIDPGRYDVRVVDDLGQWDELYDVYVFEGDTTYLGYDEDFVDLYEY